jgi:hypothetical protein
VDLRSGATVTYHGGWSCGYIKDSSETILLGSLTVSDGTAVIKQLTIQ